jgi:glucose-1-phosphate cytidylyltransferase
MTKSKTNKSLQTIILSGGKGTRMKEETEFRPKPMVEVGGFPLLWHIMRIYMYYGHKDFILALGYKGHMIKQYFMNWRMLVNDFSQSMSSGRVKFHTGKDNDFSVTHADTGIDTLTGGRILKASKYLIGDEFMVTYGDGVSDIDVNKLLEFHHKQGTLGTVTGVHPQSRYGLVEVNSDTHLVSRFREKPVLTEFISGGFMVFKKEALKYFDDSEMENGLRRLAEANQLSLYPHEGFWKAVDTYNELEQLNKLWETNRPWALWEKS